MWVKLLIVLVRVHLNLSEGEVEVGTPDNSVFYRKIGNLYPSVNVGPIRLKINLLQVRGITTTIRNQVADLEPFLNYVNETIFSTMSSEIQAAYVSLPPEEKQNTEICLKPPLRPNLRIAGFVIH